MTKKLFIVGTGTDVGKTCITGLIVKKLHESEKSVGYYKPAMSGNGCDKNGGVIPGDAVKVKAISNIDQSPLSMCPFVYEKSVSPHLAGKIEGNPVKLEVILEKYETLSKKFDYIAIEGAGGIICPLRFDKEKIFLEDIIKKMEGPCLLVADAGLGTINLVCLTAAYMKEKEIPLKGIILNRFTKGNVMEEDNLKMCQQITGVPVIACVGINESELRISVEKLVSFFE